MINKELYKALMNKGVNNLTSAQKKAIPKILSGKDVLLCAPTGYGKTLAAMIPVLDKMLKNKEEGMKTLYVTPLRALNRDVFERLVKLGEKIGLRIEVRHGDTTQYQRRKQALNPPDMLITTPETLQAILTGKRLREGLASVKTIIIDEVHELISSKRGTQLSVGLERLKNLTKRKMQLIGLSATVNNKQEVADWISSECEIVNIEGSKEYEVKIIKPGVSQEDKELAKKLHTNPSIAKTLKIITRLVKEKKSIIFVNTRELAENISSRLQAMNNKDISVHHSSLSKNSRINTEADFKKGGLRGIIATSSLELGIDIGDVEQVIQFNSPRQVNKLVQRVGRAGHTSTQVSNGVVITTNQQEYLETKAVLKQLKNKWVEESSIYHKPLDVLAHQVIGICLDEYKPKVKDVYNTIKQARPYQSLTWNEFSSVLTILKDIRMVFLNDDGTIGIGKKARFYYYDNLSTIPNEKNYHIHNIDTNSRIGTLHEGFIAKNGEPGNIFICRAEPWEIISIEDDRVNVSRSFDYDSAIPSWEGELIPIHQQVTETMRQLAEQELKLEVHDKNVIITTYFGSKVNQTIGEVLAYLLSNKKGTSIGLKNDAYRIILKLKNASHAEAVEEVLNEIKPSWITSTAYNAVKNSNAFLYRFMHVAKRFGILRKNAEFSNYRLKKLLEAYDNTVVTKEAYKEMLVEKLDLSGAEKAISRINNGELKLTAASNETINELSTNFRDFSNPKTTKEIMDVVKERLMNKEYLYYCLNCGKYVGKLSVRHSKNLECKCGSKLITFLKKRSRGVTALKKRINNQALNTEEERQLKKLEVKANLYLNYDYMAPYAIAGRGVGPTTATRILKGFYQREEDFLKKIIKAEKRFIRTKKYWK
ncbi:DEAD/DEAH box helicase [archaeon]|nr:DEAD/DEAH box helicase [archaeon]